MLVNLSGLLPWMNECCQLGFAVLLFKAVPWFSSQSFILPSAFFFFLLHKVVENERRVVQCFDKCLPIQLKKLITHTESNGSTVLILFSFIGDFIQKYHLSPQFNVAVTSKVRLFKPGWVIFASVRKHHVLIYKLRQQLTEVICFISNKRCSLNCFRNVIGFVCTVCYFYCSSPVEKCEWLPEKTCCWALHWWLGVRSFCWLIRLLTCSTAIRVTVTHIWTAWCVLSAIVNCTCDTFHVKLVTFQ